MKAHDIQTALRGIRPAEVRTAEEDAAAFPRLASFDSGAVYVGKFSGQSPWELHPEGDELLYVLDGEVEITLLIEEGAARELIPAGCVFVVPKGLWHRQVARPDATLLAVTPGRSENSCNEDPRQR